ncbi:hypothetical protein GCM10022205_33140 [Spinactinospora alkalitolerans]
MGTWGVELFDGDTALDLLDGLGPPAAAERLEHVVRTLEPALVNARPEPVRTLPEEVVAAAAAIAANTLSEERFSWNEEASGVTEWLARPVPLQVRSLAVEALDAALPADGWWWRSWGDDVDREQARAALEKVRAALRKQ